MEIESTVSKRQRIEGRNGRGLIMINVNSFLCLVETSSLDGLALIKDDTQTKQLIATRLLFCIRDSGLLDLNFSSPFLFVQCAALST